MLEAVRRSMRQIRAALSAAEIDPVAPTCAERRQFEGVRRVHGEIQALAKKGVPIEQIVRRTGHGRGLVRRIMGGSKLDIFRVRTSSIDRCQDQLEAEWASGCRVGAELWRRLRGGLPWQLAAWSSNGQPASGARKLLGRLADRASHHRRE